MYIFLLLMTCFRCHKELPTPQLGEDFKEGLKLQSFLFSLFVFMYILYISSAFTSCWLLGSQWTMWPVEGATGLFFNSHLFLHSQFPSDGSIAKICLANELSSCYGLNCNLALLVQFLHRPEKLERCANNKTSIQEWDKIFFQLEEITPSISVCTYVFVLVTQWWGSTHMHNSEIRICSKVTWRQMLLQICRKKI